VQCPVVRQEQLPTREDGGILPVLTKEPIQAKIAAGIYDAAYSVPPIVGGRKLEGVVSGGNGVGSEQERALLEEDSAVGEDQRTCILFDAYQTGRAIHQKRLLRASCWYGGLVLFQFTFQKQVAGCAEAGNRIPAAVLPDRAGGSDTEELAR